MAAMHDSASLKYFAQPLLLVRWVVAQNLLDPLQNIVGQPINHLPGSDILLQLRHLCGPRNHTTDLFAAQQPGDSQLPRGHTQLLGDFLQQANLLDPVRGDGILQPGHVLQRDAGSLRDTVVILPGQNTRGQGAPGRQSDPDFIT